MPERGATDVDPSLTEITVTFDRDMEKGMSWTGNEQTFLPPIDKDHKAKWIGKRTCVLPVKLEKGSYYRVGINSSDFQNFKSADGKPANPDVIYFTTEGAADEIKSRCRVPKVVKFEPANDATDVDPDTTEVKVMFDMPMSDGMSWCTNGDDQSPIEHFQGPFWSKDQLISMAPAELHPGQWYQVTLNSPSHIGFQSKWGVPLKPVAYKFKTAKEVEKGEGKRK